MPSQAVRTQWTVEHQDSRNIHHWRVVDFMKHFPKKKYLTSDFFHFGPGSWQLAVFASTGPSGVKKDGIGVSVCGPFDSSSFYRGRIFLKLSVGNSQLFEKVDAGTWWINSTDFMNHPFRLGPLRDVGRLLNHDGSLEVRCELRIVPEGPADASSMVIHGPGECESVGTLDDESKSTRKTWSLPDLGVLAKKERCLCSESFAFGSRLWQLHVSSSPSRSEVGSGGEAVGVLLSLQTLSGHETFFPFSWKLSVKSDGDTILRSADGICKSADEHITFSLGPLLDVQTVLGSDGILRVVCELCLLKETTDTSHAESKAGADILVRDFKKLLTSGESSDATVRVKGERDFPMHRSVLVARTPVFAAMFRHDMSESTTGIVNIADCDPSTFELFLQHVYTGRVEDLCPKNAISLYQLADKYQVDELKSECRECIKEGLSVESFCPTIRLALQHCETELTQLATEFFTNNLKEIIVTVEWQNFMGENHIVANELFVKAVGASKA